MLLVSGQLSLLELHERNTVRAVEVLQQKAYGRRRRRPNVKARRRNLQREYLFLYSAPEESLAGPVHVLTEQANSSSQHEIILLII